MGPVVCVPSLLPPRCSQLVCVGLLWLVRMTTHHGLKATGPLGRPVVGDEGGWVPTADCAVQAEPCSVNTATDTGVHPYQEGREDWVWPLPMGRGPAPPPVSTGTSSSSGVRGPGMSRTDLRRLGSSSHLPRLLAAPATGRPLPTSHISTHPTVTSSGPRTLSSASSAKTLTQ